MPCNKDSLPKTVLPDDARSSTSSGIIVVKSSPIDLEKSLQSPSPQSTTINPPTKRQPPQCLVLPHGTRGGPVVTHSDYDLPLSALPSPDWLAKVQQNSQNTYSDPNLGLEELRRRRAASKAVAVIGGCAPVPILSTPTGPIVGDRLPTSGSIGTGSIINGGRRQSNPRTPVTFAPQSSLASSRDDDEEHEEGIGALGACSMDYMNRMAGGDHSETGGGGTGREQGQPQGQGQGGSDWNMKESFSAKDHHAAVQNRYSRNRQRHYTDPVDFEGILRIIGGCGFWQIWIYFLISLQQVPHAMFNLSVMYMMFKPDHWCYVQELDITKHDDFQNWSSDQIRNIVSPMKWDEVHERYKHDECRMYQRTNYRDLSHMPFENASLLVATDTNVTIASCHSWMYDRSVMEDTIVSQWNLVCENNFHRADAQLAYALGYFIGCLVSGLSSDRFGRKPTVIGFGILASMLGIILPYSTYFPMFLLIRFLSAVCNEAADLAAYVLCMEITGNKHRGMVGSLLQAPWAIGYTLLALMAYWTRSWRTIQIITAGLHTVTILLICVLPESPRWLIVNNRVREAEAIIRKACRMNKSTLPADLELVKHAEQRKWVKRNERATILHLLKSKELIVRTLVIFVVWVATALVYYGITLNLSDQSAPGGKMFSGNFFVNNAVAGAVEIPTLIACIWLVKLGRKKSQMATLILSGLMMIGVVLSPAGAPRLVFMLLGKMFIQAAFNVLYIFTLELYPTVIRNSAVGTCSMVARMGAGVASYVAILSDITLPIVPMIIFGVFSLVGGAVVVFLPETRDQPLPDTLQDAVIFLKPDKYPYCTLPSGFGLFSAAVHQHKVSGCEDAGVLKEMEQLKMPSTTDQLPETSGSAEDVMVNNKK